MGWRRIAIIAVIAIVGAGGLWWAFTPQPIPVDLETVERGTLVVTIDDEGVARVRATYDISMPIGGDVQRIPLEVGDRVEAGTIVASIVPQLSGFLDERSRAEAEAAVRTAQAAANSAGTEISGAEAEMAYWTSEVDRSNRLLARGLTTQQAADQAQLELDRANLRLSNAKALLELRQRQLEEAQVRLMEPGGDTRLTRRLDVEAPVSGEVLEVSNASARSLPAGAPLLTVGDPRDLEVVVDLLSGDAVRIKGQEAGAPARISNWGGDKDLDARVHQIEPIGFTKISALGVEEQRVRVHLDILDDPDEWRQLGHLYQVFVRIEVERVEDAVLAPNSALFRLEEDWALYAVSEGRAEVRRVEIGSRDARYAAVKSGLEAGEQVIVHPSDRIADGVLVEDRQALAQP